MVGCRLAFYQRCDRVKEFAMHDEHQKHRNRQKNFFSSLNMNLSLKYTFSLPEIQIWHNVSAQPRFNIDSRHNTSRLERKTVASMRQDLSHYWLRAKLNELVCLEAVSLFVFAFLLSVVLLFGAVGGCMRVCVCACLVSCAKWLFRLLNLWLERKPTNKFLNDPNVSCDTFLRNNAQTTNAWNLISFVGIRLT